MKLFETFEGFIRKTLMPVAEKIDKQPHLSSVKKGMVVLTPILLLGSLAYPLYTIPNLFPNNVGVQEWFAQNSYLFKLLIRLSIGFIGVYGVMAISYFLSEHYKIYTVGAVTLALFAYLVLTVEITAENLINPAFLDSKGLFTGIFVALITVEIYRFFTKHKLVIRMPEGVPDFVSRSFELITPAFFIGLVFVTLRHFCAQASGGLLLPEIVMKFLAPAIGSLDNLWMIWIVIMLRLLFWFFGIHSAVLSPILSPIFVQYLAENIAAKEAGEPLLHVFTGGTASAFVNFTGSGVTMGLVIAMLLSKSDRYRKVGQIALIPAIFGINEPVLFGVPVILNPILLLPFIVGSSLVSLFPLALMSIGFLNKPFFDPPYLPLFFEGYLTNFDWKTPFVQCIQLILSFLVYFPFFKILEKQELEMENIKAEGSKKINEDDQKILDGMDLDF
ncbi:MAG: PTS sugar transporter subunit IIC [Brevinema sp.]